MCTSLRFFYYLRNEEKDLEIFSSEHNPGTAATGQQGLSTLKAVTEMGVICQVPACIPTSHQRQCPMRRLNNREAEPG